jgi:predicted ArsR family transcriptional regulator
MAKTKTSQKVLSAVRKGRKVTVQAVAKTVGVTDQVARRHLDAGVTAGVLTTTGFKTTGKRGRPNKLYAKV